MTWIAFSAAMALIWFGMVLGISFMEAPLKFRAPGITTELGLGIGQIVFRALNIAECVLAALVTIGLAFGYPRGAGPWLLMFAVIVLVAQLVVVKPALRSQSRKVLDGASSKKKRSKQHLWYVGFEVVKALLLLGGGLVTVASL